MESKNQQRGIQLYELGRYSDAVNYFQEAIAEDVDDYTSIYYLAVCFLQQEEYQKATTLSEGLLTADPNNPDVYFLKAQIALQEGKNKEAEEFINQAISIYPYNADYFGLKSALLLGDKKYEEGLNTVNEGLNVDAKNAYCLNLRAQFLTKLNRISEADETVENILYDNPEDSYSHANVGWVELENGNTKKALDHFKQALQFDPNFEYAREGMSTALKSKNFIYKWYLKYSFWMSKKSSKNQWIFVLGIYVAYRASVKLLSAAGMSYLVMPLVAAYLFFALGGWIMEPLSNTILNFDSYGKYLLNKEQKISGYTFGALAFLGIIAIALFYIFSIDYCLVLAIGFICALIPLPGAFLLDNKKAKNFGIIYGASILLIAIAGPLFTSYITTEVIVFFMMIGYTWIGNIGK